MVGTARVEVTGDTVRIGGALVEITGTTTITPGFNITRLATGEFLIRFPTGTVQVTGFGAGLIYQNIKIHATSGPVPDGGLCHCRDGPNAPTVARKRELPPVQFVHSCMPCFVSLFPRV